MLVVEIQIQRAWLHCCNGRSDASCTSLEQAYILDPKNFFLRAFFQPSITCRPTVSWATPAGKVPNFKTSSPSL